jgi:hypothetical protein
MIRSVSSVTAILLFALVNITTLPTTVKAQGSNVECKKAVANAKSRLRKIPNVLIEQVFTKNLNEFYSDFPQERPMKYIFYLNGTKRKVRILKPGVKDVEIVETGIKKVENSPQFMKNISQDIISKCNSISAVTFGSFLAPGCGITFGVMPNGKVKIFDPVDSGRSLRWGESYCD